MLALVVKGMLNKQIAGALGAAEKTIKIHRGRVMGEMDAASVAELSCPDDMVSVGFAPHPRVHSSADALPVGPLGSNDHYRANPAGSETSGPTET